jgi:ABC-type glycerol-3-phosphate transport system permease component
MTPGLTARPGYFDAMRESSWWSGKLSRLIVYLGLTALALFFLFPLVWMLLSSFKSAADIASRPMEFQFSSMSLHSYSSVVANVPLLSGFKNTFIVVLIKGTINVIFVPLAAYAFAKLRFRGREVLFTAVMATLMLPVIVQIIPLLLEMGALGWMDSFQALILPGAISAFYIFFMRQQIAELPDELLDAGRIDGCSEFQVYWRIVLPLIRPALAALAILNFLDIYNDFVWPVIAVTSVDMQTLQVMLSYLYTQLNQASVGTASSNAWGQVLAASTLATLPVLVLFVVLQRQFVSGIMGGAIKE